MFRPLKIFGHRSITSILKDKKMLLLGHYLCYIYLFHTVISFLLLSILLFI